MLDASNSELFEKAKALVIERQRCSTSFIKREFSIGYNKAAQIVEELESQEIVSRSDHVGKRSVLARPDDALTLSISTKGADGKTITSGPISLNQMRQATETIRKLEGKPPMKHDPDFQNAADRVYNVAADELRQFVEQFESLEAEKKDIADQQKDVMSEAKARGYDTKVLKKLIALRKRDKDDVAEEEAILDLYKSALGMG